MNYFQMKIISLSAYRGFAGGDCSKQVFFCLVLNVRVGNVCVAGPDKLLDCLGSLNLS